MTAQEEFSYKVVGLPTYIESEEEELHHQEMGRRKRIGEEKEWYEMVAKERNRNPACVYAALINPANLPGLNTLAMKDSDSSRCIRGLLCTLFQNIAESPHSKISPQQLNDLGVLAELDESLTFAQRCKKPKVNVSGVLNSLRAANIPFEALKDEKYVFLGLSLQRDFEPFLYAQRVEDE